MTPSPFRLTVAAFVVSRVAILVVLCGVVPDREDWDLELFGRYARAARAGTLYDGDLIEYPPLYVAAMVPPAWAADAVLPADAPAMLRARWYRIFFRIQIALVEVLCFIVVARIVNRYFAHEPAWQRAERLLVLVLGGGAMFSVLYARLDVLVGVAVLVAVALFLTSRRAASFAVLAVGVAFKVGPLVLAPVWVLASLPRESLARPRTAATVGRAIRAAMGWSVAFVGMVAVGMLPFVALLGPRCLDFLDYHRVRGLQLESTYALAVLAADRAGWPAVFEHGHGGVNVRALALAAASPFATAVLLLGAAALYLLDRTTERPGARPDGFLLHVPLAVFLFVLANKVFSPQYLLWLLPLAPLVPLPPRPRRWFFGLFLTTCVLTKALGAVYSDHVFGRWLGDPAVDRTLSGPTDLGVALIVLRNAAAIATAAVLAAAAVARVRAGWVSSETPAR